MILLYCAVLLMASAWLPWWFLVIFSVGAGYLSEKRLHVLTRVSCSVFLSWLTVSYFLDYGMKGKVAIRLVQAGSEFGFDIPSILVYVIIALVGAFAALIFALVGYDLKMLRIILGKII